MAKYYSLVFSSFAVDFKAALEDYYGDGVSVTSASGTEIQFSCPQICDKPLRIWNYKDSSTPSIMLQGSCNGVTFISGSPWDGGSVLQPYHLVLADNFLLLQLVDSGVNTDSSAILIAKLTNGRSLCLGSRSHTNSQGVPYFTDDATIRPIWFMAPSQKKLRAGKKIPIVKSYLAIGSEMELNADGTLAYIDGLYLTAEHNLGGVVGMNYFLSHDIFRGNSSNGIYMPNAFYVELE